MDAVEMEIESIENDDHLTQAEKNSEIKEVERDYRDMAQDSAQDAYDREMDRW